MQSNKNADAAAAKVAESRLGEMVEDFCLSTEDLQVNHAPSTPDPASKNVRIPSAVTCLPTTGLLIVGFDSGEIQTYYGLLSTAANGETRGLTPGPCFRIGNRPVLFLKPLENWSPFQKPSGGLQNGGPLEEYWSVFLAAASESDEMFVFWTIDGKVSLPRLKFELAKAGKYRITDGVVAKGMGKAVAATHNGKLMVFPAHVAGSPADLELAEELVVTKHLNKVAHQTEITSLSTNETGTLMVSGCRDGDVCLWHWGQDQFLHQVGQMSLTNLPVQCVRFGSGTDSRIIFAISFYLMQLSVTRRPQDRYELKQQSHLFKLKGGGKVSSMVQLGGGNDFMVLRSTNHVEIVSSSAEDQTLVLDQKPSGLCMDQRASGGNVYTMVSMMKERQQPVVYVWWKKE